MIKILNIYILRSFLIKFGFILLFGTSLMFLIESVSSKGGINMFRLANNMSELLSFIFFLSTAWTLIGFHKSRELIIFQTSSLSGLKVLRIFTIFAFVFSVFYLVIYRGIILKALSNHFTTQNSLASFNILNEEKECQYNLFLLSGVKKLQNNISFEKGEILEFNECRLINFTSVSEGNIEAAADGDIKINGKFILSDEIAFKEKVYHYPFDVLLKYFNEKINSKSYKTFYETISLIMEFKKFNIQTRTMEISILETIHTIISFFYMILIAFIFFSHFAPRGTFIFKFSLASIIIACIHIVGIIIISLVKQSDFLNPYLIILPSLIVVICVLLAIVFTEISFKNLLF